MATITATRIDYVPRGNGENYVVFRFDTDVGGTLADGPRFIRQDVDMDAMAAQLGAAILEAQAQQEIQQWLP